MPPSSKRWRKEFQANGTKKQAGITILMSDKIELKVKSIRRDKRHLILIEETINQEDITILNIYVPNS